MRVHTSTYLVIRVCTRMYANRHISVTQPNCLTPPEICSNTVNGACSIYFIPLHVFELCAAACLIITFSGLRMIGYDSVQSAVCKCMSAYGKTPQKKILHQFSPLPYRGGWRVNFCAREPTIYRLNTGIKKDGQPKLI
jgi:hypothetical protein